MKMVFFADDDMDDRKLVVEAFKEQTGELEWHFMENGEQLLNNLKANQHYPNLILLDLNMPVMGGLDVLIEIRKDKNLMQIPIIIFSTSGLQKDKGLSYEFGANCYIQKPDSYIRLVQITMAISTLWLAPN
jgi:CheY-like chemotaxis protein